MTENRLFAQLLPRPKRHFVPENFDAADWLQIEPLFDRLDAAAPLATVAALQSWLEDQFELSKAVDEAYNMAFVRMTVNTADEPAEKAYLHFVEQIIPRSKLRWHRLNRELLQSPALGQLPERYALMMKYRRNSLELFREENVPLESEEAKLDQQHDKIKGAQSATFDGREQTLIQIGSYLERTDRALRQRAFETIVERRLRDRDALEDIFDRLVHLRQQRARNAGFSNFRDFQFRRLRRFDYTPQHCFDFHQACSDRVMPAVRELARRRRQPLGLEVLRPWDMAVDPSGLPPLRPFEDAQRLQQGCWEMFQKVDVPLGEQFRRLIDLNLLDLENRKGKAPGGYQATLEERHLPFIFMNAVGRDGDLRTLLHEAGHAFHTFATAEEPILDYRHAPMEFCEVASMSMELLAHQHLETFYAPEDARRSRRQHLEGVLELLPWIATIDAFQHWIYTHEDPTRAQRRACWLELHARFSDQSDWSGYEEAEASLWQRQGHLFGVPFYYIEYGIAQLGALGIWRNAQRNPKAALAAYRHALSLGGSVPLPRLFEAAGLRFDFGPDTVGPLVDAVMETLDHLRERS